MDVVLPPKLSEFVKAQVEAGAYKDPSEVLAAAVRLKQLRDEALRVRREKLREALIVGERSGFVDDFSIDDLIAELDVDAAA